MKIVAIISILFAFAAQAQTFQGNLRNSQNPCFLEVVQTYFENNNETAENFKADVILKFKDSHHHVAGNWEELHFTVATAVDSANLTGLGSNNRDQVNIFRTQRSASIGDITGYAARWWHINHFHSAQCQNLKRVQE
jgi:hypothetical protein